MSGSTRILVIPLKKLILALCVIIAFIIIAAIYILSDKEAIPQTLLDKIILLTPVLHILLAYIHPLLCLTEILLISR